MNEKASKVEVYEHFVNDKLKSDLRRVLDEQESIFSDIAEYLQIKDTIEKIESSSRGSESADSDFQLETKVDLGCNFYVNARVDKASKIFIAIGYGFHLEMSFAEALKFVEKKVKILQSTADELSLKASEIKANIKFVLEGLKEIQHLEFTSATSEKSLFV